MEPTPIVEANMSSVCRTPGRPALLDALGVGPFGLALLGVACLLAALGPATANTRLAPGIAGADRALVCLRGDGPADTRRGGVDDGPSGAPPPNPDLQALDATPPETPAKEATAAPSDASVPPTECDRIAALRAPYSSSAAVHEIDEPAWPRGVEACAAEVKAHPGEARFVYQLGRAQDHLKNYIEALHDYKAAAAAGSVDAMVDLGALYYFGHGVIQSYPTAFDYFDKAAAAGSNRALGNLAAMYGDGRGVAKDDAKSLDYAEKAIEAGNPFGLKIVADHYFNGAGVPRDYQMAAQYLQQAADLGDGRSMKFLANMYESGYLGPPNAEKAGALRLRAQQVDPGSQDPMPRRLPPLRKASARPHLSSPGIYRRRYVVFRRSYRPSWQAAPGDTSCCPNSMLVCPLGRHFCGH